MKTPSGRPRLRHAQIHLPPLAAEEALLLVEVLDRALCAVWRAHGDAIADLQARLGRETPRPPGAEWATASEWTTERNPRQGQTDP